MPELPEVEAARRLVEHACLNRTISRVQAADDDKVFDCGPDTVKAALKGRKLVAANRHGKQLWFQLDNDGPYPLLHFGMTGSLIVEGIGAAKYKNVKTDDSGVWPPKFTKLELDFDDGTRLAFTDARRFGRFKLQEDPLNQEPLNKLGFDPLTSLPPLDKFTELLRARNKARLKAVLLDQAFAAGVGNWVADEVLYQARLHPEQPISALGDEHVQRLHDALHRVVQTAVDANADSDKYPDDWMFHKRWTKKKASSIDGHHIHFITAGGRTSAIVPGLQKLVGDAALVAATAKSVRPAKAPKGEAGSPKGRAAKGKAKAKAAESSDSQAEAGNGSEDEDEDAEADVVEPAAKGTKRASKATPTRGASKKKKPSEEQAESDEQAAVNSSPKRSSGGRARQKKDAGTAHAPVSGRTKSRNK